MKFECEVYQSGQHVCTHPPQEPNLEAIPRNDLANVQQPHTHTTFIEESCQTDKEGEIETNHFKYIWKCASALYI